LSTLGALKEDRVTTSKGATWVPFHIYRAHFYAGFCAVEQHDYAYAKQALQTAVSLLPTHANPRMELAHVYIFSKELDLAVTEVEAAMALTEDPCEIARGLRKIGYVRFEQGAWDAAKAAYRESLRYEPNNDLALGELELLEEASQSGSRTGAAGAGFSYGKTIVSTCGPTKL
jgi:Tfp pilus assembly protein PilF